jgi:hypothetical protein
MPSFSFSPLLPTSLIVILAIVALVTALLALVVRGRAGLARGLALGLIVLALANPSLVSETRESVKDIVAIVVDRSGSQLLGPRAAQTEAALAAVQRRLGDISNIETRLINVGDSEIGDGTRLFTALSQGLSDVPAERVAGVIALTDGVVHDIPANPAALGIKAPVHALVTGRLDERDRRVDVIEAPRFGLVGKDQTLRVKLDERGGPGSARLYIRRDGVAVSNILVRAGAIVPIVVRIDHAGANIIEIEVEPLEGELTTANNRAVATIEGIREKLRVLLVSGEPHVGERTWRNLLKSDANVDLVHFTILRPPEKQDGTPINELSLIAFPTRELFQQKIKEFDLIILDRYANQSILPSVYYDNISRYVREGGALLIAAGPEFAGMNSLARTPLAPVLPAVPDGNVVEEAYKARVTQTGDRHPVTRDLPGAGVGGEAPSWGEWLRLVSARVNRGGILMSGAQDRPLLVLNREDKGRVALFLSDHPWLWARGYREGGPYIELLRRLGHWLMKEPDLDEEALRATSRGKDISIERQTMADDTAPARLIAPSGAQTQIALTAQRPGVFTGATTSGELGLHRIEQGGMIAFVGLGPANPREFSDVFSDTERLRPLTEATGGSARRIGRAGSDAVDIPRIVTLRAGTSFAGSDWIGLRLTDSARIVGISLWPLMLGAGGLLLLLAPLVAAWLTEGGKFRRKPAL